MLKWRANLALWSLFHSTNIMFQQQTKKFRQSSCFLYTGFRNFKYRCSVLFFLGGGNSFSILGVIWCEKHVAWEVQYNKTNTFCYFQGLPHPHTTNPKYFDRYTYVYAMKFYNSATPSTKLELLNTVMRRLSSIVSFLIYHMKRLPVQWRTLSFFWFLDG